MNHTVVMFNFHYRQFCKRSSNKYQIENFSIYLNTKNNINQILQTNCYKAKFRKDTLVHTRQVLNWRFQSYMTSFILYLIIPTNTYQPQFSTFQKSHSRVVVTTAIVRWRKYRYQTSSKLALTKKTFEALKEVTHGDF